MGLAAARIDVRALRVAWMPALVILIVCCSMASWMATCIPPTISVPVHPLLASSTDYSTTHLVLGIHLVKLINTADTIIRQHESASLHTELARLTILDNRCGKTYIQIGSH